MLFRQFPVSKGVTNIVFLHDALTLIYSLMNTSTFQREYISISACIMVVCIINGTYITIGYHYHYNQPAINDALTVMSYACHSLWLQQSEEESHAVTKTINQYLSLDPRLPLWVFQSLNWGSLGMKLPVSNSLNNCIYQWRKRRSVA